MTSVHSYARHRQEFMPNEYSDPPVVSVLFPLPRAATWGLDIAQSLQSIFDQTYRSYEVIVLGDGADDSIQHAIQFLQQAEPRLKYINFKQSLGLTALQLNEGLKVAKGAFVTYMFSEVTWTVDALSALLQAIVMYDKPAIAYAGRPFDYNDLHYYNFIPHYAVIHHKSLVHDIGGFEYHIAARKFYDWDFWLRCAKRHPFTHIEHLCADGVPRHLQTMSWAVRPYHLMATRAFLSMERSKRLQLVNMDPHHVDETNFLYRGLHRKIADYIYEYEMLSWLCTHNTQSVKKKKSTSLHAFQLLIIIQHMNASYEICLTNFCEASKQMIQPIYFYGDEIKETMMQSTDAVIFLRVFNRYTIDVLNVALKYNKPVIYAIDDDLLSVHEMEEFDYLAPGTEDYNRLVHLITHSDVTVTYSPIVSESIRMLNPRIIELSTNILEKQIRVREPSKRSSSSTFRIGIVNTGSRSEEITFIWPAIARLSAEFGEAISFQIWGRLPEGLAPLHSPLHIEAATYSYKEYLERFSQSKLDLQLVPLFDNIRARKGKTPIKYLETTAAGGIGLYSNNETYDAVKQGYTGYKINNTIEDWYQAMKNIVEMPREHRLQIWRNAKDDIMKRYTSESLVGKFEAMLAIAQFHSLTRHVRHHNGKPKIAVFVQHPIHDRHRTGVIHSLTQYGVDIIWCLPESMLHQNGIEADSEREVRYLADLLFNPYKKDDVLQQVQAIIDSIAAWLEASVIALIHCSVHNSLVHAAAKQANIPYVVQKGESEQWSDLLDVYNTALQWRGEHV